MLSVFLKFFVYLSLLIFSLNSLFSASQLISIDIEESIQENTIYDPLGSTSGLYVDLNENQTSYVAVGLVNVSNTHITQAAQNILINISGISTIHSVIPPSNGFVSDFNVGGDYMLLYVPDLAPNSSTLFTYTINTSQIAPPIHLTASYSDSRIFAGLPITITDSVHNIMNSSLYTDNCIYNISLIHNAMTINSSGTLLNVTFDNSSLSGSDSGNASFSSDNRTITWNTLSGGCLNSGNTTDISYDAITPFGVSNAASYSIVNTTVSYLYNDSFSRISHVSTQALVDLDLEFEKYLNTTLTGDNATWQISAQASNPTNIDVNLTTVSLWVSQRNATGTGFTNPSTIDQDTISGINLTTNYTPGVLLNSSSIPWDNSASNWFFNYTFSASPIVWMDLEASVIDDGLQMINSSISFGNSSLYIKNLYLSTGYWLEISRNITRLGDNQFNVFIKVVNLGTTPTPASQAVQVYNFIPNTFSLNSSFVFSSSGWYTTSNASETLNDPIYNGTMHQYAILANGNPSNSSLDLYGGSENANNTWTVTYNVTGSGEFNFDDLFLTGVDPLNVGEYGGTNAVVVEGEYDFLGAKIEYFLGVMAVVLGLLIFMI